MNEYQRFLTQLRSLTVASVKMYFRNVPALFFTLFIPVLLVVIFGVLSTGSGSNMAITITNMSEAPLAKQYIEAVKGVSIFKVEEVNLQTAKDKLGKGKSDLEVIIPSDFGTTDEAGQLRPAKVETFYNEGRPQNGQSASLILAQLTTKINNSITHAPEILTLETKGIKTNNLGVIDFLIPGIMAMSIMQLGIFSVAFGFISYKTSGALRRLQATPTHPINFLLAQSVARLIIGVIQVALLLGLGMKFFHLHLVGNILNLMVVATLGTIVFLAFGFAIAGWAKDENQAAPIANLITFPMLFFSGVFFPRDGFPAWLHRVSDFLPLTYLADAMHRIANEGASLWAVRGDLLGLIIWGIIMYAVTVRIFRWE